MVDEYEDGALSSDTDVLIVMISYMNPIMTINSIESILDQDYPVRLVVWDNDSPDEQFDKVVKWYEKTSSKRDISNVKLVAHDENIFWSPAINRAISENLSDERFVGFMNNDMTLPAHGVSSMVSYLDSERNIGLIGPHGARLGGQQDFAADHGEVSDVEEYCRTLSPKRVSYLVGAFILMPVETWNGIGELDEDMPLGADDHDYCIRVKQAGKEIWVDQRVYADHKGHASGKSSNWKDLGGKSWEAFNKKWEGYYPTEEEAIKNHWSGKYHEGYDK